MKKFTVGALFAGVGGLDLGFEEHGHSIQFLSENDEFATKVLSARFPRTKLLGDITQLRRIPKVDILTAGFPCQDISLAGTRHGLLGERSGLVNEVFRLAKQAKPEFILIENVLNLLRLEKGAAMFSILSDLQNLGYNWAYRVIDSRGFGLPQRRLRVVILATNANLSAASLLFSDGVKAEVNDEMSKLRRNHNYGFYWTEGKRGVGWATDAVPTIKGGSGLGIPSAPAIFSGSRKIAGTISIGDAERLQGFPIGWTDVPEIGRIGNRWKLIGNAVSVPLSSWLGSSFSNLGTNDREIEGTSFVFSPPLPMAAFGSKKGWFKVDSSTHVNFSSHAPIGGFLADPIAPLSERALSGYISRAKEGDKKFPVGFIEALEAQLKTQQKRPIKPFQLS